MGIDLIRALSAKGNKGLPVSLEAPSAQHPAFATLLQAQEERLPSAMPGATDESTADPGDDSNAAAAPATVATADASGARQPVRSQAASSPQSSDVAQAPSVFAPQPAVPRPIQQATGSETPAPDTDTAHLPASDTAPPSVRQTDRRTRVDTRTGSAESRQVSDASSPRSPTAASSTSGRERDRLASAVAAAFASDPARTMQEPVTQGAAMPKDARRDPPTEAPSLAEGRLASAQTSAEIAVSAAMPAAHAHAPDSGSVSNAAAAGIRRAQPERDRDGALTASRFAPEGAESRLPRPAAVGLLPDVGARPPRGETRPMKSESGFSLPAASAEGRTAPAADTATRTALARLQREEESPPEPSRLATHGATDLPSSRPNPQNAPAVLPSEPTVTDLQRLPPLPFASTEAQSVPPSARLPLADATGVERLPDRDAAVRATHDSRSETLSVNVTAPVGDTGLSTPVRAVEAPLATDPGPAVPQATTEAQGRSRLDADPRLNAASTPTAFESMALPASPGSAATTRGTATPRPPLRTLRTPPTQPTSPTSPSGLSGLTTATPEITSPAGITSAMNEALGPRRPGSPSDSTAPRAPVSAAMGFAAPMPVNLPLPDREPPQANPIPITVPVQDPRFPEAFSERVSWLVREGIQVAELTLHPQELGPIRIEISMDGGAAQLNLSVAHAETRGAIEQSMERLRDMLSEQGLQLGSALFDAGGGAAARKDSGRDPTGSAARRQNGSEADRNTESRTINVVSERPRTVASGRIDLFA